MCMALSHITENGVRQNYTTDLSIRTPIRAKVLLVPWKLWRAWESLRVFTSAIAVTTYQAGFVYLSMSNLLHPESECIASGLSSSLCVFTLLIWSFVVKEKLHWLLLHSSIQFQSQKDRNRRQECVWGQQPHWEPISSSISIAKLFCISLQCFYDDVYGAAQHYGPTRHTWLIKYRSVHCGVTGVICHPATIWSWSTGGSRTNPSRQISLLRRSCSDQQCSCPS